MFQTCNINTEVKLQYHILNLTPIKIKLLIHIYFKNSKIKTSAVGSFKNL